MYIYIYAIDASLVKNAQFYKQYNTIKTGKEL